MIQITSPSAPFSLECTLPSDKSISHRALIISAISTAKVTLTNLLDSKDVICTKKALLALGANIVETSNNKLSISGVGLRGFEKPKHSLDFGNSGTGMRLMLGIMAGQNFSSTLVGDESLSKRPMQRVIKPLQSMGAQIESDEGYPPLKVKGSLNLLPFQGAVPVSSAQVVSSIQLASLYAGVYPVIDAPSNNYRDHTDRMLSYFKSCGEDFSDRFNNRDINLSVPGDVSSAAFILLAVILTKGSSVVMNNVGLNPNRIGVLNCLKDMGANLQWEVKEIVCNEPVGEIHINNSCLNSVTVDASEIPTMIDELPVLFVAAAVANGTSIFNGLSELRVKESNRLDAMISGLTRMGVNVCLEGDSLTIVGKDREFSPCTVDALGDHRIAMTFCIAAANSGGSINVSNYHNIDTSFPEFFTILNQLGYGLNYV